MIALPLSWKAYPDKDGWTEFGETWDDFSVAGLSKAGTLVCVLEKDRAPVVELIGSVNRASGTCECCEAFSGSSTVLRYKQVWSLDDLIEEKHGKEGEDGAQD
jgi:hypothetical protein